MSGFKRGSGFCPNWSPGGFNCNTPGEASFSPLSLFPLLWVKETGLYKERTGASATTPAVDDEDTIGTRLDYSGNANHLTATADSKRPVLDLAAVNGLNAILPDAVDDFLQLTSPLVLDGEFTIYAVGTREDLTTLSFLGSTTAAAVAAHIHEDNAMYFVNDAGTQISINLPVAGLDYTGTLGVRIRRDAADSIKILINDGVEATVGTLAGAITVNAHGARVFDNQYNGGTNKHCEMFVKDEDIFTDNPAGDELMRTYLGRWGVTM